MDGLLLGAYGFCANTHQILSLIGWVLVVFKIAIPLIIIVVGLIDLGKAAVSSKPEEIKKSVGSLLWRLVGGIAIFFVPMLVMVVFGWVSGFREAKGEMEKYTYVIEGIQDPVTDWDVCYNCIVSPGSTICSKAPSDY